MSEYELKTREQSDPNYQWDLTTMFESDEAHQAAIEPAKAAIEKVASFQGKLSESAETLADAIDAYADATRQVSHLYVYMHLKNDQDTSNSVYQAHQAKMKQLYTQLGQASSYFKPELLSIPEDELEEMIQESERLQFYKHYIDDNVREREHILSQDQELILVQAGEVLESSSNTFALLNNSDFEFPTIQNEKGEDVQLTHGNYSRFMETTDREIRKNAFENLYKVYNQFSNTLASTLSGNVKKNNYLAKVRNYDSARHRALSANNIPESVYDTLLETVDKHLPLLHRYVALRQDLLSIDDLEMYDMYTPLLGEPPIAFTYEEAQKITLEALKPMGEDYLNIIRAAYDEKWIDVYENKGKRSGGYSSGSYDSKPYILLNWQDNLNSLYTLIHELGHSAHSYLSNHNQEFIYADYPIFLAEIASTNNEILLTNYLLDTYKEPEIQLYILNHFLDGVKSTVFRQTQFAEFEHFIYQQDQAGQPLTAEFLNQHYQSLNAKYYGSTVNSDSEIRLEWARIPHFYYNYYVFQYATGFSAAVAFANQIYQGNQQVLENYLGFLKSGSSHYAIETMQTAGIDMTKKDYIVETMNLFEKRLNQFEALLAENK